MNNLTENTGVPGNVFVLSDGATDEIFSNLGYGDLDNVERVIADLDEKDRPLPRTGAGASESERDGKTSPGQPRDVLHHQPADPDKHGHETDRRRFVQLRTIEDGEMRRQGPQHELSPAGGGSPRTPACDGKDRHRVRPGRGRGRRPRRRSRQERLEPGDIVRPRRRALGRHRRHEAEGAAPSAPKSGKRATRDLRAVRQGHVHHPRGADGARHRGGRAALAYHYNEPLHAAEAESVRRAGVLRGTDEDEQLHS